MFSIKENLPNVDERIRSHVYLITDYWDDWNKFRTQFMVYVVDASGETHQLGSIKIGEVGLVARGKGSVLEKGFRTPTLAASFERFEEKHFSLGQSENYYETLNQLDSNFKNEILTGLRDCAFDLDIFVANRSQDVMSESLLRGVEERNVRNRFNRLANGNAILTRFEFEYEFPVNGLDVVAPKLTFEVVPASKLPTNVHVLIGRNGVGKTRCIQNLSRVVLGVVDVDKNFGSISRIGSNVDDWSFAGLVSVSFSVFDDFDLPLDGVAGVRPSQVGLRKKVEVNGVSVLQVKTPDDLARDFTDSLKLCRSGPRVIRWRDAIKTLQADPLFEEINVSHLLDLDEDNWVDAATRLFKRLSSGHAIAMLTITRLVELVDERTLVILDEPEAHLHPPLLAALIRAVADLLGKRNGMGLIATHSPVVLQEAPQTCIWKLRRSGLISETERPSIETFGENVSILSREIFGLEVTRTGFHVLLTKAIEGLFTYEDVLEHFSGQLGSEARAIARGLIATRNKRSEDSV